MSRVSKQAARVYWLASRPKRRFTAPHRVYLLADFGKGPKRVGILYPLSCDRERRESMDFYNGKGPMHWAPFASRVYYQNRMDAARAWWLVEAESADAARRTIEAWSAMAHDPVWPSGRILASGGAR